MSPSFLSGAAKILTKWKSQPPPHILLGAQMERWVLDPAEAEAMGLAEAAHFCAERKCCRGTRDDGSLVGLIQMREGSICAVEEWPSAIDEAMSHLPFRDALLEMRFLSVPELHLDLLWREARGESIVAPIRDPDQVTGHLGDWLLGTDLVQLAVSIKKNVS